MHERSQIALAGECPQAAKHKDYRRCATEIRRIRESRVAKKPTATQTPVKRREQGYCLIPLGQKARFCLVQWANRARPRVRNWEPPQAGRNRTIDQIDNGRYSGRCTYTHWTYRAVERSYALAAGRNLWWHGPSGDRIIAAQRGWQWRRDDNGIMLVRLNGKDDYHPNSDDLDRKDAARWCARQGIANAITRRAAEKYNRAKLRATEQEKKEACARIRRAEKEGCLVCLADSLKAGNCRGGSESWARRNGIDPMAHTLPSALLAKANGEYRRVSLVVLTALRRHTKEMQQGYALLSEHTA